MDPQVSHKHIFKESPHDKANGLPTSYADLRAEEFPLFSKGLRKLKTLTLKTGLCEGSFGEMVLGRYSYWFHVETGEDPPNLSTHHTLLVGA